MLIKIKFFGELKEKIGKRSEVLEIERTSIKKEELIPFLKKTFGLSENEIFNIAINNSLSKKEIKNGDTVSLHPIYRGG